MSAVVTVDRLLFALTASFHYLFLAWRTTGRLAERARRRARRLFWPPAVLFLVLIWPTYSVRDTMLTHLRHQPWELVFPVLTILALARNIQ
jgi:cytochrome bd-type quinol oxidase subunit 2